MATADELIRLQADQVVKATALTQTLDGFIARVRADVAAQRVHAEDEIRHADRVLGEIDRHLRVLEALYHERDAAPEAERRGDDT
jgi:hypothetical protein